MATTVVVNGAYRMPLGGGGLITVDATVAGKHHQAIFSAQDLANFSTPAAALAYIASQMITVDAVAATITTVPAGLPNFIGTVILP
jgi:hypothetical protein